MISPFASKTGETSVTILLQFIFQVASNLAIAISSGYYLWNGTESNPNIARNMSWFCNSNYGYTSSMDGKTNTIVPQQCFDLVNVYDRFTVVLQLYFACSILALIITLSSMLTVCLFLKGSFCCGAICGT